MRIPRIFPALAAALTLASCSNALTLSSPNGELTLKLDTASPEGELRFELNDSEGRLLQSGCLGLGTDALVWKDSLNVKPKGRIYSVREDYTMLTGKRSHCVNEANARRYSILNAQGEVLGLELRLFGDGLAFRYSLEGEHTVTQEFTSYNIPEGSGRWIQTYERDGYEAFYPYTSDGKARGKWRPKNDWGYPALIEAQDKAFVLITEAGIRRGHCGSYLNNGEEESLYRVMMADSCKASGEWQSPWRVLITGELATVVESTLVTDLSEPCAVEDTSWIEPGCAAWIYWANNHGSSDFRKVCEYIDLASEMGWTYDLIDAEWDVMGNGGNIEDALAYAVSRGVKPMIWYNSSTNWINGAPTPYYRLNKPEDRAREYAWLVSQGVSGIKVDFFRGDSVEDYNYYLDLMEDAAKYGLLINFHGATLPRGWQRTYPNLMTMEGVYGAEWYNNTPQLTGRAACHNATLPFTRNVVGSMDYTPGTFSDSQHPHITTDCHELALTLLFESGLQHMPDRPEVYLNLPDTVRTLLSTLPTAWDDTRLLAGYPGEEVVLARRKGDVWYVAGINGSDSPRTVDFSIERLKTYSFDAQQIMTVTDCPEGKGFTVRVNEAGPEYSFPLLPRGGFVAVFGQTQE